MGLRVKADLIKQRSKGIRSKLVEIRDIMDAADARGRCSEEKQMGQAGA